MLTLPETLPALTLYQPWASMIALGLKQHETRSYEPPRTLNLGGLLAIHAGKVDMREDLMQDEDFDFNLVHTELQARGFPAGLLCDMPLGAMLCVARLKAYAPTAIVERRVGPVEIALGDYSPGRWAWELQVVHTFDPPIRCRGYQRVWTWDRVAQDRPEVQPPLVDDDGGNPFDDA